MKKLMLVMVVTLALIFAAGCGMREEIIREESTGLYLRVYKEMFPPDAIHIKKEKEYWYSFERYGKKYLLYYINDMDSMQIYDY